MLYWPTKINRSALINALGAIKAIEGSIDKLTGCLRVGAFVSSDTNFTQQPQVANGASELLQEIFGEAGRHARAAVGSIALPLGATRRLVNHDSRIG